MALAFGIGVAFGPSPNSNSIPAAESDNTITGSKRSDLLNEKHVNIVQPSLEDLGGGSIQYNPLDRSATAPENDEGQEYMPAGQHLLVDIKNVEEAFLNSEERLADAMVQSVEAAGLTMLSYHCHALKPAGVSCVGVLLESHISFHTWPEEGVITLDLFTCGENPLLPVVPDLERLFGVPRVDPEMGKLGKATTQWSHELRGFRNEGPTGSNVLGSKSDLAFWIMSALQYAHKEQVVSTTTPYQRIDVWDYLDVEDTPSYEDAMKHNLTAGDPRWLTSEVATPDRYIFLNGMVQNMKDSNRELYESLVHPAMFAHSNPKNVAIIGGGHGATMREVLKHNTVQSVTMIEVDEALIDVAKEHLPHLNDCSNIIGRSENCYDDDVVNFIHEDAQQQFKSNAFAEPFDVIVFDVVGNREVNAHTAKMWTDEEFLTNIFNSLSDDGVFVVQMNEAPTIHDPRASLGLDFRREEFIQILEKHDDTAAMFIYEEAHCGFLSPISFLVVCKDKSCRKRWFSASDAIDNEIYDRISDTVDEKSSLIHFDGSTQVNFRYPPIAWETVYCRRDPVPFECDYRGLDIEQDTFDYDPEDEKESSFTIKKIEVNDEDFSAVYANQDIPEGSYIMPYDLSSSFVTTDDIIANLQKNTEITGTGEVTVIQDFLDFIQENGHKSMADGSELTYVEVGASFLIRRSENKEESNVGTWMPPHPSGKIPVFSPVYERHMNSFDVFLVATKDIKKGEEVIKPLDLWNA